MLVFVPVIVWAIIMTWGSLHRREGTKTTHDFYFKSTILFQINNPSKSLNRSFVR